MAVVYRNRGRRLVRWHRRAVDQGSPPVSTAWMSLPEQFRTDAALLTDMLIAGDRRRRRRRAQMIVAAGAGLVVMSALVWTLPWLRLWTLAGGLFIYAIGVLTLPSSGYATLSADRTPFLYGDDNIECALEALRRSLAEWVSAPEQLPACVADDELLRACGLSSWLESTCGRRGAEVARTLAPGFSGSLCELCAASRAAVA
jgi:hypothetical protein